MARKRMKYVGLALAGLLFLASCRSAKPPEAAPGEPDPELSRSMAGHYRLWSERELDLGGGNFVVYHYLVRSPDGILAADTPLLVFLDGSGYQSVLGVQSDEQWILPGPAYGFGKDLFPAYDLMIPEKPNVIPGADPQGAMAAWELSAMEDRVQSAVAAIDAFLEEFPHEAVFLYGVSEGGVILPQVYHALENRDAIDRIVLWGSGGMSQLEEFRILGQREELPESEAGEYCRVEAVAEEIRRDPDSIEKTYFGLPYRRWSGFLFYSPLNDLLAIRIPILLIHGALDLSSPVESARKVASASEDRGRGNLTYWEYETMGHGPGSAEEQEIVYARLRGWLERPGGG
jgi:pimeloyl-ACP methyl ester carboxylesterase